MSRLLLLPLLVIAAVPAMAADKEGTPESQPEKIASLIVYGNDPCPRSSDQEIVVCARQPESERYRIPKEFRGKKKQADAATTSWSNTASELEFVSRAGTPNSCSPVGSGGQTGCYQQFLRTARAQRAQDKADAAATP